MLSKVKAKYIKSLQLKKYRKEEQSFIVEGAKSVAELLASDFDVTLLAATPLFIEQQSRALTARKLEAFSATEEELGAAGSFQTNQAAIAVAKMKPNSAPTIMPGTFMVALDDIKDPGNLGTIIRTADWYGIRNIIASQETADVYNPKSIAATMGSFLRVNVFYTELDNYLKNISKVYGAFMNGDDVHTVDFSGGGVVVIGNESVGISPAVAAHVQRRISIPRIGQAESLNAGIATAIILDNLVRSNK